MAKSQSPAKKLRSLKRLIIFRKKYRVQHSDNKPTKSNLSICIQTSVSIEPSVRNAQQETIKQSQPFTLNDFLGLAETSRLEDEGKKKEKMKEKKERKKEKTI